jgi:hypothetical protein
VIDNKEDLPYKERYELLSQAFNIHVEPEGNIQLYFQMTTNGIGVAGVYIDDIVLTLCQ